MKQRFLLYFLTLFSIFFCPLVLALDLTIEGGNFVGYYKNNEKTYAWSARSDLWIGPRIAFCIEPGSPLHTGTYSYAWSSESLDSNVAMYLARIDELPRNFAQRAVHHLIKGEIPSWMEKGPAPKAWIFRHKLYQDVLVIDIIPSPYDVLATEVVPDSSDERFLSVRPTGIALYMRNSSRPVERLNSVPEPSVMFLLLTGVVTLFFLEKFAT